ncbi:hypothetical protein DF011_19635 [Burkholderia ubonensis]|nr:hypothetical protein CJO70_08730 [Burkholderia ubonensis]PAJ95984.1 hypothetical protein CJO69_02770 [Burkholderia ubonensis]PAK08491.1 hypothetical protein CJO67_07565 [Burkholderia ubonensis]RQP73588.1 hypothetical protein DF013_18040 [Burkholderia ubonensis]RQP81243.1 hypothetical protein DF014_20555 [Burkholderia ubonensis]
MYSDHAPFLAISTDSGATSPAVLLGDDQSDSAPAITSRFSKSTRVKNAIRITIASWTLCDFFDIGKRRHSGSKININNANFLLTMLIELVDRVRHPILQSAPRGIIEWFIHAAFANFVEDNLSIFFDVNFPWHERI